MHQLTCCVKEAELVAFAAHRDGGDIVVKNCARTRNSLVFSEIASPTIEVCCLKAATNLFRFSKHFAVITGVRDGTKCGKETIFYWKENYKKGDPTFGWFSPKNYLQIRRAEHQSGPNSTPNISKQSESAYHLINGRIVSLFSKKILAWLQACIICWQHLCALFLCFLDDNESVGT